MKQLPSYPRAYLRPGPTPKLPVGLEELMEGLTREVLKHNPTDIHRFAADHMQQLLRVRNAHLKCQKTPNLEEKIKIAQNKIKEMALQRIKNIDNELKKTSSNVAAVSSVSDETERDAEVKEEKSEINDKTGNIESEDIEIKPQDGKEHPETKLVDVNNVKAIKSLISEVPEVLENPTENVVDESDNNSIANIVQDNCNDLAKNINEINADIDIVPIISNNENVEQAPSVEGNSVPGNVPNEINKKEDIIKTEINTNNSEVTLLPINTDEDAPDNNATDTNSRVTVSYSPEKIPCTNLDDNRTAEIKLVNDNEIVDIAETETKIDDNNKSEVIENLVITQENVCDQNDEDVPKYSSIPETTEITERAIEDTEKDQKFESLNNDQQENILGINNHKEISIVKNNFIPILNNPHILADIIETEESKDNTHRVNSEINIGTGVEEQNRDIIGVEEGSKDNTENENENTVKVMAPIEDNANIEDNSIKSANSSVDRVKNNEIGNDFDKKSPVCVADVIHAPIPEPHISINEKIKSTENVPSSAEKEDTKTQEEAESNMNEKKLSKEENVVHQGRNDTANDKIDQEDKILPEVVKVEDSSVNKNINENELNLIEVNELQIVQSSDIQLDKQNDIANCKLLSVKSVESDNITGNLTTDTDITIGKIGSTEENTNDFSSESNVDNSSPDSNMSKSQTPMDLETAAVTIQKVFRTFMFKSRASTLDDVNYEGSIDIPYIDNVEDDLENKENEIEFSIPTPNKERRALGISRMDTVLQTVNEEKSLSLSTDDSSLSSAATTIQAHVRGFLVRNRLNSNKTNSNSSLVNSADADVDSQKNKTVLNIHIVPERGQFMSRDESIGTSIDLPLDVSPRATSYHSLGSDISERRKQLKREDAIQSVSPPSNNSGKLSEDVDSVKEFPLVQNETVTEVEGTPSDNYQEDDGYSTNKEAEPLSSETTPTKSTTGDTVIEVTKSTEYEKEASELDNTDTRRQRLTKMSSDEMDVVTPTSSTSPTKLMHSGEFHDVLLPTRISRNESSVVREFKSVLVYFLLWNK